MLFRRITPLGASLGTVLLLAATVGCNPSATGQGNTNDNGSTNDNGGANDNGTDSTNDNASGTGTTYYVSTEGNDTADGLTAGTAFKTVAHAVAAAIAGDTVAIVPGSYVESITMEAAGGADGTLTIRGAGGVATIDCARGFETAFWCDGCTNITFEDLEIINCTDIGLLATASDGITVRNVTVHGCGFAAQFEWSEGYGIHIEESRNVTVEDCETSANGPNPQVAGRWLGTGIDLFALTDAVVRNNNTYDNTGGGMLVEDCVNVLVEGNTVTGNYLDATIEGWWDGAIWVDGGRDVTLRNNTITANIGPGVIVSDEDNKQPTGYVLEGNTITGNTWGLYVWNFGTTDLPDESILQLTDNDISGNTTDDFWIVDWECPPDDPCDSGR